MNKCRRRDSIWSVAPSGGDYEERDAAMMPRRGRPLGSPHWDVLSRWPGPSGPPWGGRAGAMIGCNPLLRLLLRSPWECNNHLSSTRAGGGSCPQVGLCVDACLPRYPLSFPLCSLQARMNPHLMQLLASSAVGAQGDGQLQQPQVPCRASAQPLVHWLLKGTSVPGGGVGRARRPDLRNDWEPLQKIRAVLWERDASFFFPSPLMA